jgi:hypothetical protein
MLLELGSALIGLFGGISTAVTQYKTKKLELEHERLMAVEDRLTIEAEAAANVKITEAQVKGATELREMDAYVVSQQEGNKEMFRSSYMNKLYEVSGWAKYVALPIAFLCTFMFALVDLVKGFTRPALTAYYAGASLWLTMESYKLLEARGLALTPSMAHEILTSSVETIMCLAITCVTWWFSDRRIGKILTKRYE